MREGIRRRRGKGNVGGWERGDLKDKEGDLPPPEASTTDREVRLARIHTHLHIDRATRHTHTWRRRRLTDKATIRAGVDGVDDRRTRKERM